jgi:hypothetical protein
MIGAGSAKRQNRVPRVTTFGGRLPIRPAFNRRTGGQGSTKGRTPFCRGGLARGGKPLPERKAEAVKAGVVKEGNGFGFPFLRGKHRHDV